MGSSIPLIGLPHQADIFRLFDVDDGAGGIKKAVNIVVTNRVCRISAMTDEDEQKGFGNVTGQHYKVVMEYTPEIQRSDIFAMSSDLLVDDEGNLIADIFDNVILGDAEGNPSPIEPGVDFRIIYVKPQIDHLGKFHHTSLVIELEDEDTDGDG